MAEEDNDLDLIEAFNDNDDPQEEPVVQEAQDPVQERLEQQFAQAAAALAAAQVEIQDIDRARRGQVAVLAAEVARQRGLGANNVNQALGIGGRMNNPPQEQASPQGQAQTQAQAQGQVPVQAPAAVPTPRVSDVDAGTP